MRRGWLLALLVAVNGCAAVHAGDPVAPSPAPITDPAEVTRHLRLALTQAQYAEAPESIVSPHLEDILSQWFRQLGARIGEFKYATRMPAFESMLMTVLVAFALAVLIYVMVRLTRRRLRLDPDEPPPAAPLLIHRAPESYDSEIARAVEAGDWRTAWLAGWRQFLSRLEQRSLVTADRTRTNREYLRQLHDKPVPASALQLLTGAVDTYDRFIYGRVAIEEPDWRTFRGRLDEAALLLHLGERKAGRAMKQRRNAVYVRVLLVVLVLVVLLVLTNKSPRHAHSDTWIPSSYNPVGAGSMALYNTLDDLHWPVARWREPLSRLPAKGSVLVITRSPVAETVAFSEQEIELLDSWVKRGNTLVLLGALTQWEDTRDLLQQAGFVLPEHTDNVGDLLNSFSRRTPEDIVAQPTPAAGTAAELHLPRAEPLPAGLPPHTVVLWRNGETPYVADVPRGEGHVICALSDRLFSSAALQQGDDVAAVLRLLTPGGAMPQRILFEESHHGYSSVFALVRLLQDSGVRFAGMLALLGALAFLGSSLVRFGPVVPLHRATGRSSLEFVDSIADLYLRADLRNDTIRYLFAETHQQALERLHLPATASHELIAARMELAHPHLPKWKKLAHRFDSHDYVQGLPPAGWLRVARQLIEIKTALA